MKILTIDIEVAPNMAHVWGLFDQSVSLTQLRESAYMLCFAAKWHHEKKPIFSSIFHDGKEAMIQEAWDLISEADALVTWNGKRYDMPHLNREFIEAGFKVPSPVRHIDLLLTARRQFKFPSNKLDYVAGRLLGQGKVSHTGHQLWVDCMAGDKKAWALMKKYNLGDIKVTENLYDKLLPWITDHPALGLYQDVEDTACQRCTAPLTKQGFAYTAMSKFQRYQCKNGHWSRGTKRIDGTSSRGIGT